MSTLTDFFDVVVDKGGEFTDRWLDREFGAEASPPKPTTVNDQAAPIANPPAGVFYVPVPGTQTQLPVDKKIIFITGGIVGLIILIKVLS